MAKKLKSKITYILGREKNDVIYTILNNGNYQKEIYTNKNTNWNTLVFKNMRAAQSKLAKYQAYFPHIEVIEKEEVEGHEPTYTVKY